MVTLPRRSACRVHRVLSPVRLQANPVAVLIPCHRVIRQSGHFGGYAWGEGRKRALIGREAAAGARDEAMT
jgi:O-6-methylguanine DNA methyltransferase